MTIILNPGPSPELRPGPINNNFEYEPESRDKPRYESKPGVEPWIESGIETERGVEPNIEPEPGVEHGP